ncbi:MAG: response regulator [Fibrobacterota bacterium]
MGFAFMIVDDSVIIRAFVRKTLGLTGLEIDTIVEACDGEEGLRLLAENKLDVILTDINMPKMDGLEMIRRIRQEKKYNTVKIVIITTEGSRQKVLEAAKIGINGYLKKPFGPEEALEVLGKAVTHGN